ncbi:GNAT family N-acetyltransferase [Paraburkholderia aspalathi]|uniref:GNAT family N-acetyltransferase n=1 Tax=Paraburkholderia aspalathi TaxID=1324617 RepID=UPI0038BD48BF
MPDESAPDEVYIDSLAVRPESRGRGVAQRLVKSVIEETDSLGLKKIGLLVDKKKDNMEKCIKNLDLM